MRETVSVFAYCVELEDALNELFGHKGKWNGLASAFRNHRHVRDAILDASRVIRKRLKSILTADERLRLTTDIHLDAIDRLAKTMKADGIGLLPLLGQFIHLTAILLGYDWLAGKPNREIVYYQTLEQQFADDLNRHPTSTLPIGKVEYEHRATIIKDLYSKGLRISQIARILNQSEPLIKDILVREGIIDRQRNIKST